MVCTPPASSVYHVLLWLFPSDHEARPTHVLHTILIKTCSCSHVFMARHIQNAFSTLTSPRKVRDTGSIRKEKAVRDVRASIKNGNSAELLQIVSEYPDCISSRDAVGAAPVHFAFLMGKEDLGKLLVTRYPECATLVYTQGPYEGENILHIAIVQRKSRLVQWLLETHPTLLNSEAIGQFFALSGATYFGGYPLLFAVASNQWPIGMLWVVVVTNCHA